MKIKLTFAILFLIIGGVSFGASAQTKASKNYYSLLYKHVKLLNAQLKQQSEYGKYFQKAELREDTTILYVTPNKISWNKASKEARTEAVKDWLWRWAAKRRDYEGKNNLTIEIVGVKDSMGCFQKSDGEYACY